jgi:predicted ArsR family transcriptional regulator
MKTIKQIADDVGVSKQAVRNKIANLGLQSSLQKSGKWFVINEQQEALILEAFGKKSQSEPKTESKTLQSESQSDLRFALQLLEREIEFLREQLKAKDDQLERLDRRLAEAQILHADTKKMPLLSTSTEPAEPDPPPLSFWGRFFGPKNKARNGQ